MRRAFSDLTHPFDRCPDERQAVELIPRRLRALTDLVGRHRRMRRVDSRAVGVRNQPVPGHRGRPDQHRGGFFLFPLREIHGAWKRLEQDELRERDSSALGEVGRRLERVRLVGGQPEDEGPEHVHAVMAERLQPRHERLAGHVEVLVDGLQPLGRHRFDADERAANLRLAHGLEEFGILGRLHRNLRVEHEVVRQSLELRHQLEPLGANRLEILEMGFVRAAARRGEIRKRHGIEIVVGEQDESEAASSERYDFADHVIDATLSRLLPVGAPHRAERAMLRTAADRLHRSPHVFVGGQQIPSRGDERAAFDSPAVIERLERPRRRDRRAPSTRPCRRRP